jgi:flagellin-specific chaperone FliS
LQKSLNEIAKNECHPSFPEEEKKMALADLIKKIIGLNATPASIAREIAEMETKRAGLVAEKAQAGAASLDSFGDRRAREKTRQRRLEIEDDLADIEMLLPRLQQELALAQAAHRMQRLAHYRAEMKRAADILESALTEVLTANQAAATLYDSARAEFGDETLRLSLPIIHFGAPVVPEAVDHWRAVVDEYLAQRPKPASIKSKPSAPSTRTVEATKAVQATAATPRVQRPLLLETAGAGQVLVEVRRSGFESPSGHQCRVGDIVAMPAGMAKLAVENGAVDFRQVSAAA